MTNAQVKKRLVYWIEKLNLGHWDFKLCFEEAPNGNPGALGSVVTDEDYDWASLSLQPDIPDDDLDRVLVHELMHVYFRGVDEAGKAMHDDLGPVAGLGHKARWKHEEEALVNRLAVAIVGLDK